jgi:hypothetical protein
MRAYSQAAAPPAAVRNYRVTRFPTDGALAFLSSSCASRSCLQDSQLGSEQYGDPNSVCGGTCEIGRLAMFFSRPEELIVAQGRGMVQRKNGVWPQQKCARGFSDSNVTNQVG